MRRSGPRPIIAGSRARPVREAVSDRGAGGRADRSRARRARRSASMRAVPTSRSQCRSAATRWFLPIATALSNRLPVPAADGTVAGWQQLLEGARLRAERALAPAGDACRDCRRMYGIRPAAALHRGGGGAGRARGSTSRRRYRATIRRGAGLGGGGPRRGSGAAAGPSAALGADFTDAEDGLHRARRDAARG